MTASSNEGVCVRVLVADDHKAVADGLRAGIESQPDLTVAAVVNDGVAAVEEGARTAVDVALLDVDLPGVDGLTAGAQIIAARPATRVVFFSGWADPAFVLRAVAVGARGYLLKQASLRDVIDAVRRVAAGEHAFCREVLRIARAMGCRVRGPKLPDQPQLTSQEQRVLRLVAQGRSLGEASAKLEVSVATVRTLLARAQERLGLRVKQRGYVVEPRGDS